MSFTKRIMQEAITLHKRMTFTQFNTFVYEFSQPTLLGNYDTLPILELSPFHLRVVVFSPFYKLIISRATKLLWKKWHPIIYSVSISKLLEIPLLRNLLLFISCIRLSNFHTIRQSTNVHTFRGGFRWSPPPTRKGSNFPFLHANFPAGNAVGPA